MVRELGIRGMLPIKYLGFKFKRIGGTAVLAAMNHDLYVEL